MNTEVEKTEQKNFFSKLDSLRPITAAVINLFFISLFIVPPLAIVLLVLYSIVVLLKTRNEFEDNHEKIKTKSDVWEDLDEYRRSYDPGNLASPVGSVTYDEDRKRWDDYLHRQDDWHYYWHRYDD